MAPWLHKSLQVENPGFLSGRRESSGRFFFQHNFAQHNPGNIAEFYENQAKLGCGAFGSAHRVVCRRTGVQRAVKSITLQRVKDPSRFEAEISIARQLDHPNVVRLFEIFRDSTHIYLVMELCTGGELFDRIMRDAPSGFSEACAAPYVRQMLAAISYLHQSSFVHRDVKPENFLLQSCSEGAPLKLIDFGLARKFEFGEEMTTRGGTPYYVAPEVLTGKYNERIDVWSIGVISYILLCGYPPFNGRSDREVVRRVKEGCFKFLSPDWNHVSEEAQDFVALLLTYDRQKRPSAQAALAEPWTQRYPEAEAEEDARALAAISEATAEAVLGSCCSSPERPPPGASRLSLSPSPGRIAAAAVAQNLLLPGGDFVSRLQAFHAHTRIKRVALTAVARQLPDEDLGPLRRAFEALDRDGDGLLSMEEVRQCLLDRGVELSPEIEDALESVDSDGSGGLDFTEFLAATVDEGMCTDRNLCEAAFRTLDLNNDGKISVDELEKVLGSPERPERSPSKRRVQHMMVEADSNGDGCINFEEFYATIHSGAAPGADAAGGAAAVGFTSPFSAARAGRAGDDESVARVLFFGGDDGDVNDGTAASAGGGSASSEGGAGGAGPAAPPVPEAEEHPVSMAFRAAQGTAAAAASAAAAALGMGKAPGAAGAALGRKEDAIMRTAASGGTLSTASAGAEDRHSRGSSAVVWEEIASRSF